jgi:hypothetical protein
MAAMNILLVSPQTPTTFWSAKHAVRFISKRAAFPPLGLLTVAAMLPRSWQVRLVDMDVTRLRDADLRWADYVLISAMIVHKQSIDEEIIPRCQRLGRTIIGGGPLFDGYEEYVGDVRRVRECRRIIADVVRKHEAGGESQKSSAVPDVSRALPRWDLINVRHYATMPCSFCGARSTASSATSSS